MANESRNREGEIEDAEKHVAAILASALIARGFNMPAASSTTMAAAQVVDIYRLVLDRLRNPGKDLDAGSE